MKQTGGGLSQYRKKCKMIEEDPKNSYRRM